MVRSACRNDLDHVPCPRIDPALQVAAMFATQSRVTRWTRKQRGAAAFLALIAYCGHFAGCDRGVREDAIEATIPPQIALTNPSGPIRVSPREPLEPSGRIVVEPGAWVPAIVVIKIAKGSENHGSFAIKPEREGNSQEYSFRGELKAPQSAGAYTLYVTAIKGSSADSSSEKSESLPAQTIDSSRVELVVTP